MVDKNYILKANQWIVKKGLAELTWGNVSALDKENGRVIIKPSGVSLSLAIPGEMAVVLLSGEHREGKKPSVDTPTHIEIYNHFPDVRSIAHTHSKYATIFAQANRAIPCVGTTHADYFYGTIPCIPHPNKEMIEKDYEKHTGRIIGEYFKKNKLNYNEVPGCIVRGHGAFVWGKTIETTLETTLVLEIIAEMAYKTLLLEPSARLANFVIEKHFTRKHGSKNYYGQ
jgi:L-ribulose-5-phosphate 4-epimerase